MKTITKVIREYACEKCGMPFEDVEKCAAHESYCGTDAKDAAKDIADRLTALFKEASAIGVVVMYGSIDISYAGVCDENPRKIELEPF